VLRIFVIDGELESDRRMSPLPIAIDIRPVGGRTDPSGQKRPGLPQAALSGTLAFLPLIFILVTAACHHIVLFCFLLSYLNTNSPFVSAVGVIQVQHAAAALPITR